MPYENHYHIRSLEEVLKKIYMIEYPPGSSWELFPQSSINNAGKKTITYREIDSVGRPEWIESNTTQLPSAKLTGQEHTINIRSFGEAYGYSWDEVKASADQGVPLETTLASEVKNHMMLQGDYVNWYGDTARGIGGILGNSNVPQVTPITAAAGGTLFADKTAAEMLEDLNNLAGAVKVNTLGIHEADTLVLPLAVLQRVRTLTRDGVTETVIENFRKNNPHIRRIEYTYRLNDISPSGGAARQAILCYKYDYDSCRCETPVPFKQFLPDHPGGRYLNIDCVMKVAGAICPKPLTLAYMENI